MPIAQLKRIKELREPGIRNKIMSISREESVLLATYENMLKSRHQLRAEWRAATRKEHQFTGREYTHFVSSLERYCRLDEELASKFISLDEERERLAEEKKSLNLALVKNLRNQEKFEYAGDELRAKGMHG